MKHVSYNSYDFRNVEVVPVIASFDSLGHIKPLYVRIGENAWRVDSYWEKYSTFDIVSFNCRVSYEEYVQNLLLTYYAREAVWTIPKYNDK